MSIWYCIIFHDLWAGTCGSVSPQGESTSGQNSQNTSSTVWPWNPQSAKRASLVPALWLWAPKLKRWSGDRKTVDRAFWRQNSCLLGEETVVFGTLAGCGRGGVAGRLHSGRSLGMNHLKGCPWLSAPPNLC
jgi:hypothetical protein